MLLNLLAQKGIQYNLEHMQSHLKPNPKLVYSATLPFIFLIVYLLLPTSNSSLDAYGYADYVNEGKNLFLSHHLLYNALGFFWVKFLNIFGSFDTLATLKVMNAILASASLLVLGRIFLILGYNWKKACVWICFLGSSWGVMRFATENETYIAPILFSLLASLYLLKHLKSKKGYQILLSGFFAAFACLVHQIHFFWWFAFLLALAKEKNIKTVMLYALPAVIVPLAYILALVYYYQIPLSIEAMAQFVLRDFESGSATVSVGTKSILFVGISFVRTFFQAHGYFVNLLRIHPWLYIVIGITLTSIGLAISQIKKIVFTKITELQTFAFAHILAFALHLFFAFLSHGNAEFMVMLPFLMAISLSIMLSKEGTALILVSLGMFAWNLFLGLVPLKSYAIDGYSMVAKNIYKEMDSNDKAVFVLFNKPAVENQVKYYTGQNPDSMYVDIRKISKAKIQQEIELALNSEKRVYTDCLFRPNTLSRESLTTSADGSVFYPFATSKIDSASTLSGKYYLVEISKTLSD